MRFGARSWWTLIVGAVVVAVNYLGCSSGFGPSATSPVVSGQPAKNGAVHALEVSPSPFPTWEAGGATGDFRVHPDPPEGGTPLDVRINMCHATEPSPGIDLHYHVEWGDGSDDRGFCRLDHVYTTGGQFQAVACVWDRIPADWPGSCLTTTFTASSPMETPTPTPAPAPPAPPPAAGPSIASFTATPGMINVGQSSTLAWTTTNATSCSINNGVGSVGCNASTNVSPGSTTTYTLTATGAGGSATATATVTVNAAAPTIGSFTANPTTITAGGSSTLSWSGITNATTCSINNGVGSVSCGNASTSVSPAANTTYTLTATGAGGSATATASVTVNQPPTIGSFTATPGMINVGQSSTLAWTTTNATSCSINNSVGSVGCNASTNVSPAANTTYTLTATGPGGTTTATRSVTFNSPAITSFSAVEAGGCAGQGPNSVTLTWASTNATLAAMQYMGQASGQAQNLSTSGSATVQALFFTVGQVNCGDTVRLFVYGPGGNVSLTITL